MKLFPPILIFTLFLASCTPVQDAAALPDATSTVIIIPPEATATLFVIPSSQPPLSTKISCDPRSVDYCITDGHFILQRPVTPSENDSVDTTYRYASTANGTREPHHGVEFLNKFGTPVQAAADGIVIFAGQDVEAIYSPWSNFYGNLVVIKHDNDLFTLYAHLSGIDVEEGDEVKVGEQIGEVGQSGAATGSHLHFEVRIGNGEDYFSTQNPELWLVPEIYERNAQYGVLMISIMKEFLQFQEAELTVARYPAFGDMPEKTYYLDTYVNGMAIGDENAVMSDLPAGRYRIALILNSHLYERWIEVESGQLTQVVIVAK